MQHDDTPVAAAVRALPSIMWILFGNQDVLDRNIPSLVHVHLVGGILG